jgi:putative ABC transport system ATP-binding protein
MIEAIDLHKTYLKGKVEVRALRGIHLTVERGKIHFVVGPSGSGKSTLLHLMGALDRPTKGRVLFDGKDLAGMGDRELSFFRRKRVGFVFQNFNLIPTLTALENTLVPRIPGGLRSEDRDRAMRLLEQVGLAERADHRPNEMSGGETQRVALARALINDPLVVLADEPTGELDSETSAEVFSHFRRINEEQGMTFVIVTHDISQVRDEDLLFHIRDGVIT